MEKKDTKIIAFHLPQFHSFPENDMWWGKGFTEWTNTKKAKKLYSNHNQPREPLNDNYYNLLNYNSMKSQMELAKEYNVYGFCYYHYWFNGKLLMEGPLEKLLEDDGEKLNYCFCWANEPWTRTWEGKDKEVLMPQVYGGKEDWENHFNYLLRFFKDTYYIKIDNKPILVLYRTSSIENCEEMIEYWNKRAKESGFEGIYIVEEKNCFQDKAVCKNSDAVIEFEPLYTMTYKLSNLEKTKDRLESIIFNIRHSSRNMIYNYDRLWENIIKRKRVTENKKNFLGAFVDWDNTARKGKKGRIVRGASPEKFKYYFNKQIEIAIKENSEFVFINAWNEWGEGTYLEPDKVNGLEYLKSIRDTLMK